MFDGHGVVRRFGVATSFTDSVFRTRRVLAVCVRGSVIKTHCGLGFYPSYVREAQYSMSLGGILMAPLVFLGRIWS